MVDFLDNELKVGDRVARIDGYNGGKVYLSTGYVQGFTAKRVRVSEKSNDTYAGLEKSERIVKLSPDVSQKHIDDKYTKQLLSDLEDLRSLYFFGRCPCCTHLVHSGHICSTCGCDDGVYKDGEYTEEEIAVMRARK